MTTLWIQEYTINKLTAIVFKLFHEVDVSNQKPWVVTAAVVGSRDRYSHFPAAALNYNIVLSLIHDKLEVFSMAISE